MHRWDWRLRRLALPAILALIALIALLWLTQPPTQASPREQPSSATFVLRLRLPALPVPSARSEHLAPQDARLLVLEEYAAALDARRGAVAAQLATLRDRHEIYDYVLLPDGSGFTVFAPSLPPAVGDWPEVERIGEPVAEPGFAASPWAAALQDAVRAGQTKAALNTTLATTLTLNAGLHSGMVSGTTDWPQPLRLQLWRGGSAVAEVRPALVPDGAGGYAYAAELSASSTDPTSVPGFAVGDTIEVIQASRVISLPVPSLTAAAVQRTAMVSGRAPANAALEVTFLPYGRTTEAYQLAATAGADARYAADFSPQTTFTARDYGYVFYTAAPSRRVYTLYEVPYVRVDGGGFLVDGVMAPGQHIYAQVAGQTSQIRVSASAIDGSFTAFLTAAAKPGTTVVVTDSLQTVTSTVTSITAHANPVSDIVTGTATPGRRLRIELHKGLPTTTDCGGWFPPAGASAVVTLTVPEDGQYAASFTGLIDIEPGDYGFVFVADAAGHETYHRFGTPYLQALTGDAYQLRLVASSGGPLTVTITAANGLQRTVRVIESEGGNAFCAVDSSNFNGLRLLPGDSVSLVEADGTRTTLSVPELTAAPNWSQSSVTGMAPANGRLRGGLDPFFGSAASPITPPSPTSTPAPQAVGPSDRSLSGTVPTRTPGPTGRYFDGFPTYAYNAAAQSGADGSYAIDFGPMATMQPGDSGAVFYRDPAGQEAYVRFTAAYLRAHVGTDYVEGVKPQGAGSLVLRGADGSVKAQQSLSSQAGRFAIILGDAAARPVTIAAGDVLELVAGSDRLAMTVETLQVDLLDRTSGTIVGVSPANATLAATFSAGDEWRQPATPRSITASGLGTFSVDLGPDALARGDCIDVVYTASDGNQTVVRRCVPRLVVYPISPNGSGAPAYAISGAPGDPATLSVQSGDGTTLLTGSASLDAMGSASFPAPLPPHPGYVVRVGLPEEDLTLTVPLLSAQIDGHAGAVVGQAPPGAHLVVLAPYGVGSWMPVVATVTGTFAADWRGTFQRDPIAGSYVVYLDPDGHRVYSHPLPQAWTSGPPHFSVALGSTVVCGDAAAPGLQSLGVRGPGGMLKGGVAFELHATQEYCMALQPVVGQSTAQPVSGGDTIELTSGSSTYTWIVPVVTAQINAAGTLVTGQAVPAALCAARVPARSLFRSVYAGASGRLAMDWTDNPLRPRETLQIDCPDEQGNHVVLEVTAPGYEVWLAVAPK